MLSLILFSVTRDFCRIVPFSVVKVMATMVFVECVFMEALFWCLALSDLFSLHISL